MPKSANDTDNKVVSPEPVIVVEEATKVADLENKSVEKPSIDSKPVKSDVVETKTKKNANKLKGKSKGKAIFN